MGYFDNYKERVLQGASNSKEKTVKEMQKSFDRYLKESPTATDVVVTYVHEFPHIPTMHKETIAINDFSENDQSKLDEKIVKVRHDLNFDIGCYVHWDNCWWLAVFQEHKVVKGFKKLIIRRCNQILRYGYKGIVYDIPLSIENLTMYSDGIADEAITSVGDSKRQIWYGYNNLTKTIGIGTRVALTNRTTFRITHINDFEYNGGETGKQGLIKSLILETATIDKDDLENNVAYNPIFDVPSRPQPSLDLIMGEKSVYIGTENEYIIDNPSNDRVLELKESYEYCLLSKVNNDHYNVEIFNSFKNIGKTIELVLKDTVTSTIIGTKKLIIRG